MRYLVALLLLGAAFAADAAMQPADDASQPADDGNGWLDSILGALDMSSRSQRNNNPGNIRHGNDWQGEVAGTDAAFETFASPADGFRALAIILKNYQTRYGLRTIRGIINRYAPPSENLTGAYVDAVSRAVGVGPDVPIDLNDSATLAALMRAIATHEDRRAVWADADIYAGIAAA